MIASRGGETCGFTSIIWSHCRGTSEAKWPGMPPRGPFRSWWPDHFFGRLLEHQAMRTFHGFSPTIKLRLGQQEWKFMGKSWGISWLKAAHVAGDLDIALKHINDMSHIKIVEEFCLPALRCWSTQLCVRNLSSIVYDSNFPSSIKQCSKPLLVDYYMGYTTLNYVILCYTTSMLSYPIVIEDYQNPWPAKSHKIVWVHPHSILMIQCVMGIFPTNINIYIVVPFNMDDPLKKNMWVCSNSNHPQFYHFYRWHKHASTINP